MARFFAAAIVMAVVPSLSGQSPAPVPLTVRFKLTDLDYKPIPRVQVRLVFGSDVNWQKKDAGQRFTTDDKGEYTFTTSVVLDRQMKKKPTNFLDSLASDPVPMDHLLVAAELEWATYRWLHAIDIFHIPPGGDTLLDHSAIWTRDTRGDFTVEAKHDQDGWHMPEFGKLVLSGHPGYEVWQFALHPDDADPAKWKLDLAFKRHPPPIRR